MNATFQCADAVPQRDCNTGHVDDVGGHLEREGLVELGRHITLDDVCSSRLNRCVVTHHGHLRVQVCMTTYRHVTYQPTVPDISRSNTKFDDYTQE